MRVRRRVHIIGERKLARVLGDGAESRLIVEQQDAIDIRAETLAITSCDQHCA